MKTPPCPSAAGLFVILTLLLGTTSVRAAFPDLRLVPVSSGAMVAPVDIAHAGDGSGRLFIADQLGTIRILNTATGSLLATPFLDLSAKLVPLNPSYDERGLLGLAFHPDYETNGKLYVYYSAPSPTPSTAENPVNHMSVVAEYTVSAGDANVADAGSERILFNLDQPQFNHNGGDLCFSPEGKLFISLGDGGSSDDNDAGHTGGDSSRPANALGNSQDKTKLFGKILRIDPLGSNGPGGKYGIPGDNPFVGAGGGVREEIYAYGLRNPWRMSYDSVTSRLYVGDVGQDNVEEVNLVVSGGNYGWRNREGTFVFEASAPGTGPFIDPIGQYAHPGFTNLGIPDIGLSVTGGEVYRGALVPGLAGKYVFADWSTDFGRADGSMLGLEENPPGTFTLSRLTIRGGNPMPFFITAFGSDEPGELYVATRTIGGPKPDVFGLPTGTIFRIAPAQGVAVPTLLGLSPASDTGSSSTDGITLDPTPTIRGYAPLGSTVRIFANGVQVASQVVDRLPFEIPTSTLFDGAKTITATGTENGSTSAASAPLAVTIDTVRPNVGIPDLVTASDSGASASDNVTSDNTPTLTATGDAGITIQFTSNLAGLIGSGAPGTPVTMASLADGTHQITAIATSADTAGNLPVASSAVSVIIDTATPAAPNSLDLLSASDTGPSNSDNDTFDLTPEISGNGEEGSTVNLTSSIDGSVGTATGALPWTITATPLSAGLHQFTATATDLAGNTSAPSAPLSVTVTSARDLKPVAIPGTVPGIPSADAVSWSANSLSATGIYDGLLRDPADPTVVLGTASRFLVANTGAFSGTVQLRGRSFAVRGTIPANGFLDVDVPVSRSTPISLELQLRQTLAGGYVLRGTIAWGGSTANAEIPRAPFSKTSLLPDPFPGLYTMLIPSQAEWTAQEPSGDGWARVSISTAGAVSVTGVWGDGLSFTESAYVSGDLEIHLFSEPYRTALDGRRGRIGGRLVLGEVPNVSDFAGKLYWEKVADVREVRYPGGFVLKPWAIGSKFTPPLIGQPILSDLINQDYNAELSLIGPTAPATDEESLDRVLSWKATNVLVHYGPESLSGSVSAKNGAVSGSFYDPVSRVRVGFAGVAFQKQKISAGTFVNGTASGAVRILPGINFEYPGSESAGTLDRIQPPGTLAGPPTEPLTPFATTAAGRFGGILTSGGAISGALENLVLTSGRLMTGTLWIDGKRYSFRQTLGTGGDATFDIPRTSPLTPISVDLDLTLTGSDGFGFGGTITIDSVPHTLDAQRQPLFTKIIRAPQEGIYTLAMRAPDVVNPALVPGGDGYGTMAVSYLGNCSGTIILADGTAVTLAGHVARSYDDVGKSTSEWSFHRGLYGRSPKGYLAGKLSFRTIANVSDVDGEWHWVKQTGASPVGAYATIDVTRKVVGSRYSAPLAGVRAMDGLTNESFNVWMRFGGLNLGSLSTLDRAATWTSANRLLYFGPQRVRLSFNPRNGLLTGTYTDVLTGVNLSFGGVLLQTQDLITGSYRGPAPGFSGLFTVEPRLDP